MKKEVTKPQPVERPDPTTAQVVTRLTSGGRDRIRKLAEAEGVTIQQLGLYAWSLALQAYGLGPLDEAA